MEQEVFKRTEFDYNKLIKFGFTKENNIYRYSKPFLDNFRVDIIIDEKGILHGNIIDLIAEDEYTAFRIESQNGSFVNKVREEYKSLLTSIRENCTKQNCFITAQANRIANSIKNMYQDEPAFLWDKYPGYGVFRNITNNKWYAIIMNIDKSKLNIAESGEIEIINLKLEEEKIPLLLTKGSFYPSYHMNKKNWLSIVLDDSISDEEILAYVKESHSFVEVTSEWLIPANPKYYDIVNSFKKSDIITWKQSSDVKVGDTVFIYVGSPVSALLYKCVALEVNIPYAYQDKNLKMNRVMKLKLVKEYDSSLYSFDVLKGYGVRAIRGPRSIPKKLSDALNS